MSRYEKLLGLYNRYTRLYQQQQSLPDKLKKVLQEIEALQKEMDIR